MTVRLIDTAAMRSNDARPRDSRLDPFRDAVWELSRDGQVAGYLTTHVLPTSSLPFLPAKREVLWSQVHWLDGETERSEEDYGPRWLTVSELERGTFESDYHVGVFWDAKRLEGPVRDGLWERYGPPE